MYIVSVLIEHGTNRLSQPFSYLSNNEVMEGVRVRVMFNHQKLIGYSLGCQYTNLSSKELALRDGFRYNYILEVIDDKPLLNKELVALSEQMSKFYITSQIVCLQAMLPKALKPKSGKSVAIKSQKAVRIIQKGEATTKTQKALYQYLLTPGIHFVKDLPYSSSPLKGLVEQGLVEIYDQEIKRIPQISSTQEHHAITLTKQQQDIVDGIMARSERISLIHGVTGSGKTEIYLALTKRMLSENKNVIMLVPEIALTPMMVAIFKERFGDDVAIFHSRLSEGERYDEYRRIAAREVHIVVGARSAIFAPLMNIGLIIMDEEHDASYKQESAPRYATLTIAKMRAKYHHANIVLGSATPSVESYARALKGVYDLYELPERINKKPLPACTIVDMAQEAKANHYGLLSRLMEERLEQTLEKGEQAILLLNKRGYASFVKCEDCGEVVKCPHCDVTLTYHKSENSLKCHYCGYTVPMISHCPHCHSSALKRIGIGTQRIEEELHQRFYNAKIIRYDYDTTRNKNDHVRLLEAFEKQEANILLGTQMIAKGLDFENVTFVGVLNADLTLAIPDYRSSERTFDLLAQVGGRSGRGKKTGTVVIQTYNPDHYAIVDGAKADYRSFYNEEMKFRKLAYYPPYCHLVALTIQSAREEDVEKAASDIKDYLVRQLHQVRILGPAKLTIYKLQDIYRMRIMIKYKQADEVFKVLNQLDDFYNHKTRKVALVCDFNPYTAI